MLNGILVPWGRASGVVVERIVAVVNEDIIVLSELNEAIKPYLGRMDSMQYNPTQRRLMTEKIRSEMLTQLIDKSLTEQEIRRHQLTVSPDEVDAAIDGFKRTYGMTDTELAQALARDGLNLQAYRKHVEEQILRTMLVNREVKSRIVITQTDIENHYNRHPELYGGSLRYHLYNILLRVPPHASSSEQEQLHAVMQGLREQLGANASIENIMAVSQEAGAVGGDLGLFELEALAPEIRQALEGLATGEFSEVIATDHGWQLFMVADMVQTEPVALASVAAEIEDELYREIVDRRFEEWLTRLRTESYIRIIEQP